jgi:hypothetical protein
MTLTNHKLVLIIEDDILFYPAFLERLLAHSPVPIGGLIIARPAMKHNRYRHALKQLRHFRISELLKLLELHVRRYVSGRTLAAVAKKHGIPSVVAHGSVNTPEMVAWVEAMQPSMLFSASPLIVGKRLLAVVPHAINMHFSMLPAYKGIMPLFHAMAAGEKTSGISLHAMIEKIDEGEVLYQREVPLRYDQSLMANYQNFFDLAPECVISLLGTLQQGVKPAAPASGKASSYFRHPDAMAWQQFRTQNVPFI